MPGTPQTHTIAYCLWLPFPRVILQNCFTRQRSNRTLTVAMSLWQAFVLQRGRHTQLPARGREGRKVRTLFHRYVCLVRGAYTTVCYCHFCCHCDKKNVFIWTQCSKHGSPSPDNPWRGQADPPSQQQPQGTDAGDASNEQSNRRAEGDGRTLNGTNITSKR